VVLLVLDTRPKDGVWFRIVSKVSLLKLVEGVFQRRSTAPGSRRVNRACFAQSTSVAFWS